MTIAEDAGVGPTGIDPVCAMTEKITETSRKADHQGVTFHFCGETCRTRCVADPWFYLSGSAKRRGKLVAWGDLHLPDQP